MKEQESSTKKESLGMIQLVSNTNLSTLRQLLQSNNVSPGGCCEQKEVVWSLAWLVVMLGLLPGGRRGPQPTLTSAVMIGVSLIFTLTLGGFFIVCAHRFILPSPSLGEGPIQYVSEAIFMWCVSLCSWVTLVSFWSKSGALVSLLDNLETVPLCTISHTGFAWRAIAAMLPNLGYFILHCSFYVFYIIQYSSVWVTSLFAASMFWITVTPSVPAVFVVVLLRLVHDSLVTNNAALERVLAGNPTTTRKTLSVNPTGNPTFWQGSPNGTLTSVPGNPNETSTIWPENPTGTITAWPGNPTGTTTAWPGKHIRRPAIWPGNPNAAPTTPTGNPNETLTSVPGNSKTAPINTIMAWNRNTPTTLIQVHARNLELRRLYEDLERVLSIPLLCYDTLAVYTLINSFFFIIADYNNLMNGSRLLFLAVTNFFTLGVLGSIGLLADNIRDKMMGAASTYLVIFLQFETSQ
ncbi:hypothetical protein Pmani_020054 [Petrolisthes manimaculis]|uniref:Gustatory receptor n=1 Tax=Petrolisthes manimaculis TaxID=1843537 RepID=A0AAE1U3G1_9EUCA|nr:hypothetical protein Pmani_020054 [Petrolisthes manimaculis]